MEKYDRSHGGPKEFWRNVDQSAATFAYDMAKRAARLASAKNAHDSVVAAAHRAQADALMIESRAKMRMADEYDAAQERGEIAKGRPKSIPGENSFAPTVADIGISSKDVFEARQIRDAEAEHPGIIRETIDAILEAGADPTRAAVNREINTRLSSFSGDNEWYTPARYVEMARAVLGEIDVDPASNAIAQAVIKAAEFYTAETNGLDKEWRGTVWLNPPYSQPEISDFVDKLLTELSARRTTASIVLTNNSGDTAWHHSLAEASAAMCVTRGRIRFESPTRASNSPAMGQSFFYFGNDPDKFAGVFEEIGRISKSYWV